jgi:hypothetical protein
MLKILAALGVGSAFALASFAATAQTGYGVSNHAPSTSTFDRAWNHANESKERARAGAAYVRRHAQPGNLHSYQHYDQ